VASDAVYQLGISDSPVAQDNPFRDRIVLIGATFVESRDVYPTPRGLMNGVEIHANILHTLLSRSPDSADRLGDEPPSPIRPLSGAEAPSSL